MNVSSLETIQRDFADDVDFYYIYKTLAHPNLNGYVEPYTLAERVLHVKEAQRTLDTRWTWLIDNMDNEFKHAMGDLPNSEFVIDPEGKVARARVWSNAAELRADLEELIGPVDDPTTVDELNMNFQPPPDLAPSGVVPGVERPLGVRALRVMPKRADEDENEDEMPLYVKLRAEAGRDLLDTSAGTLVLSFRPDPLYGVHWNNLVEPIRVEIKPADGVELSETTLTGPAVQDHESDVDPREFALEVSGASADKSLTVTALYFACTDEWCLPFTSVYEVSFQRDEDGGSAMTRRMDYIERQGAGRGRRGGRDAGPDGQLRRMFDAMDANGDGKLTPDEAPAELVEELDTDGDGALSFEEAMADFRQGGDDDIPPQVRQRFQRMDADGDGKLTRDEMPEQMRARFSRMDVDGDGFVTIEEMAVMRRAAGRRGERGGDDGNEPALPPVV